MIDIKVTVIIPVYGVEEYIEKCARSLFEQTMTEGIEFIFVDDASPDKSIEILNDVLKKYPQRKDQVKIIHHKKNRGSAAARNTGIINATGKYLIHCDSDDWVERDMYECLLLKAEETNADLVACDYWGDYEDKHIIYDQTPDCNVATYSEMLIKGQLHNSLWNKLIKKEIYDNLAFAFREGVDLWEDVSVTCRLIHYVAKIAMIHKPLYHYVQTNSSSYTKQFKPKSIHDIENASTIVIEFYKNLSSKIYQQEIKYIRTRAFIASISRLPYNNIAEYTQKNKNITYKDIKDLNIPFHNRVTYLLILNKCYFLGKAYSRFLETAKTHLR